MAMKRRAFIAAVGGVAAWPLVALAQPLNTATVGVLVARNPEPFWTLFREGMRDLGYGDSKIRYELRSAEGKPDLLSAFAAELVQSKANVIVAYLTPAIAAAKQATREIPIVMAGVGDPVATGFIANLARPGGNITGTASSGPEMGAKTLELVRDLLPSMRRVSVLANAGDPFAKPFLGQLQPAGEALHLQMQVIMIHAADELAPAFVTMKSSGTDAVVVQPSLPLQRIGDLAIQSLIPAVSPSIAFAREGGLAGYGAKPTEMYRKAASYVDKILKGSKPADLPVELPTQYELAINLRTAKVLGLPVPPFLLARADEVIE
jgi:putative tryptophan/tyrosine transport system substrate-binding protein